MDGTNRIVADRRPQGLLDGRSPARDAWRTAVCVAVLLATAAIVIVFAAAAAGVPVLDAAAGP